MKFAFKPLAPGAAAAATPAPVTPADDTTKVITPAEVAAATAAKPVTPVAAPVTQPAVDAKATVVPDPAKEQAQALTVPQSTAVSTERAPVSYHDDSDETEASDIILPRLNIVQKVGDLSNQFTEGDILFNKETVLVKSPKPGIKDLTKFVRIVVCGFRVDRLVEKTSGGKLGKIVDNEAQAIAHGGTTNWNEHKATGKPLFQTLSEALLLVEKPEGIDDPSFSLSADGKQYALAVYAMKGTAYTNGTKVIRTARKIGWLADGFDANKQQVKRGYTWGFWKLGSELKQFDTNFAWAPLLQRDGETGPEVRALAASVLG